MTHVLSHRPPWGRPSYLGVPSSDCLLCWQSAALTAVNLEPGRAWRTTWQLALCVDVGPRSWLLIQSDQCQREWRIHSVFYNLISEGTYHYFCCILFIRSWSLGPACTQRKRDSAPSLEERYIKDFVDCSETATVHTLATRYLHFSHMQNMLMP